MKQVFRRASTARTAVKGKSRRVWEIGAPVSVIRTNRALRGSGTSGAVVCRWARAASSLSAPLCSLRPSLRVQTHFSICKRCCYCWLLGPQSLRIWLWLVIYPSVTVALEEAAAAESTARWLQWARTECKGTKTQHTHKGKLCTKVFEAGAKQPCIQANGRSSGLLWATEDACVLWMRLNEAGLEFKALTWYESKLSAYRKLLTCVGSRTGNRAVYIRLLIVAMCGLVSCYYCRIAVIPHA